MKVNKELKEPFRQKAFKEIQQRLSITLGSLDEMFSLFLNNKRCLRGEKKKPLGIFQLINYINKLSPL